MGKSIVRRHSHNKITFIYRQKPLFEYYRNGCGAGIATIKYDLSKCNQRTSIFMGEKYTFFDVTNFVQLPNIDVEDFHHISWVQL